MKSNKLKLTGIVLGAALTSAALVGCSSATANTVHSENMQKTEKKMGGSCGAGKCGGDMKKEMKKKMDGSCGAGKCGGDMKKEMKKKVTGSCGAGKCG